MKVLRVIGGVLFLSAMFPAGVLAQRSPSRNTSIQVIQVVSSFVASGQPAPQECSEESTVLVREIHAFPQSGPWRWIVLCDEAAWEQFLRRSGRRGEQGIYASTNLTLRTTYLRGATLLHPEDFRAQPAHVIAHELAHIVLSTSDEDRADAQCRKWMAETGRQYASLTAHKSRLLSPAPPEEKY